MENLMFNVPSVMSQSCFKYSEGDDGYGVDLMEREYNYFYALLYIYRKKLLKRTPDLLIKEGEKYKLNDSVDYDPVKIELIEFSEIMGIEIGKVKGKKVKKRNGVVTPHQYENIRPFLNELSEMSIVVNVLGKNKDMPYTEIKMVESLTLREDETLLTINCTKEFVKTIIHTDKYFKKVNLKTLFKLRGKYTKPLFLLFNDYSRDEKNKRVYRGKKDFERNDFEKLFGKAQIDIEKETEKINSKTDLSVSYVEIGKGKTLEYKFTIKNNEKPTQSDTKETNQSEKKNEKNMVLWEESVRSTKEYIKKGGKVRDEEKFTWGTYNKKLEKLKPSESQLWIDEWLEEQKRKIEYDDKNPDIPMIVIKVAGISIPLTIDEEYRLNHCFEGPKTNSPKETEEFIKSGVKVEVEYHKSVTGIKNSCLLSPEELKNRR